MENDLFILYHSFVWIGSFIQTGFGKFWLPGKKKQNLENTKNCFATEIFKSSTESSGYL